MNLKIVKFLLVSALFCSVVFAFVMISTDLYAITDNYTEYMYNENKVAFAYVGDPIGGGHPCKDNAAFRCVGDSVGGGHPCENLIF